MHGDVGYVSVTELNWVKLNLIDRNAVEPTWTELSEMNWMDSLHSVIYCDIWHACGIKCHRIELKWTKLRWTQLNWTKQTHVLISCERPLLPVCSSFLNWDQWNWMKLNRNCVLNVCVWCLLCDVSCSCVPVPIAERTVSASISSAWTSRWSWRTRTHSRSSSSSTS